MELINKEVKVYIEEYLPFKLLEPSTWFKTKQTTLKGKIIKLYEYQKSHDHGLSYTDILEALILLETGELKKFNSTNFRIIDESNI